jgi:hypothetical protein
VVLETYKPAETKKSKAAAAAAAAAAAEAGTVEEAPVEVVDDSSSTLHGTYNLIYLSRRRPCGCRPPDIDSG